jgi:hypothetical protein
MAASRLQCVSVWIVVTALTGCTTLRPLHDPGEPESLRTQLKRGDRVEVVTHEGQRVRFEVTEIGESALIGTAAGSKAVEIPQDQIAQVEVRRQSGLKNSLLAAGALGILLLVAIAAAPAAILSASAP